MRRRPVAGRYRRKPIERFLKRLTSIQDGRDQIEGGLTRGIRHGSEMREW